MRLLEGLIMDMTIIQTNNGQQKSIVLNANSKDGLFAQYFKKHVNRYKYCHSVRHEIIDEQLRNEYQEWISDVGNYANNGGDMF